MIYDREKPRLIYVNEPYPFQILKRGFCVLDERKKSEYLYHWMKKSILVHKMDDIQTYV